MIKLTHSIVPIPPENEDELTATDSEVQAELEALGYMDE